MIITATIGTAAAADTVAKAKTEKDFGTSARATTVGARVSTAGVGRGVVDGKLIFARSVADTKRMFSLHHLDVC